jgi:hypothetical protein
MLQEVNKWSLAAPGRRQEKSNCYREQTSEVQMLQREDKKSPIAKGSRQEKSNGYRE